MIKNIIFDIGGIILEWGNNPLIELLNKTDYEVNKICKIIYEDSRFKECILGFDALIKRFDLNKEETIFFDDSQRNVKSGNEYGIKSYIFNSIKDITVLEL